LQAELLTRAARYFGVQGRPPADIDVLVIGEPDRGELDDAAERAQQRSARHVNVTVRTPAWWLYGKDGFRQEVVKRPLLTLLQVGST
jgi:hypothetical protein